MVLVRVRTDCFWHQSDLGLCFPAAKSRFQVWRIWLSDIWIVQEIVKWDYSCRHTNYFPPLVNSFHPKLSQNASEPLVFSKLRRYFVLKNVEPHFEWTPAASQNREPACFTCSDGTLWCKTSSTCWCFANTCQLTAADSVSAALQPWWRGSGPVRSAEQLLLFVFKINR